MKTFTFRYDPSVKTLKDMGNRMDRAVKTGVPDIQSDDELRSGSIKNLLAVATENRINLFMAIVEKQPGSLYELAQILGKDQSYILKEAKTLEALGLISLEKIEGEGRPKLKPISNYDHIVIDIEASKKARVS